MLRVEERARAVAYFAFCREAGVVAVQIRTGFCAVRLYMYRLGSQMHFSSFWTSQAWSAQNSASSFML